MNETAIIRTILGDVKPSECGIILPHEHLSMDYQRCTVQCKETNDVCLNDIKLPDLHWIHMNPYSHPFNLKMDDEPVGDIVKEVSYFKESGGMTIVDNTVTGISRDIEKLVTIAKESQVHIIAGTGFYLDHTLPDEIKKCTTEKLASMMEEDISQGIDSGTKCGLIGEIGTSWPITQTEKRSLQAAAMVQESTKAPVMIHPGRHQNAPIETLRIYLEGGGDARKCTIAHLDRTLFSLDQYVELASYGCYLELDHFGIEVSYYQNNPEVDMPSDAERMKMIHLLIQEGLENQILISHDIHTRHRLQKYGGHGLRHILNNVIPKMRSRGMSPLHIESIIRRNPQRWLSFCPCQ